MKLYPNSVKTHYHFALYLLHKSDYKNAEKHLLEALILDPKHLPALSLLGDCNLKKGDFKQAHKLLLEAHTISPLNPKRSLLLARLYNEWSIDILEKSLQTHLENPELLIFQGKLFLFQKNYVKAVQILEKIKRVHENLLAKEAQVLIQFARKMGSLKAE